MNFEGDTIQSKTPALPHSHPLGGCFLGSGVTSSQVCSKTLLYVPVLLRLSSLDYRLSNQRCHHHS